MEDNCIVDMYWARNESAIEETRKKYEHYCYKIANNILDNKEDSDECVNDTYLAAWNCIPPQRPQVLSAFLGRLTRNISLKKWRDRSREKRGGGQVMLDVEELKECIPSVNDVENVIEAKELAAIISRFLRTLSKTDRIIFMRRYWYFDSIEQICKLLGCKESKVKMNLHRTRKKLQEVLTKEGVCL